MQLFCVFCAFANKVFAGAVVQTSPSTLLFSMKTLEATRKMETLPAEAQQQQQQQRYFRKHSHMTFTSIPARAARVCIHTPNLPSLILE